MTMLLCPPGVYRAQTDTAVLTRALVHSGRAAGSHVLDVGTGCGALAVAAWRAGARSVTAVDLSRRSVLTARLNCLLNGAFVSVRRGDLFEPVGLRRFDLVLANPPYVPAATAALPRHRVARCWDGGTDGRTVLDRICATAAERLTPDGVLMMVHSGVCGSDTTIARLADAGLTGTVVDRVHIPFGPVMRARAALLERRGLIEPGADLEELVVVEARAVPPERRRMELTDDGPLLVSGPVQVVLPDGTTAESDRPVTAVCLCRRSRRYPWCDTSHRTRTRLDRPSTTEETPS